MYKKIIIISSFIVLIIGVSLYYGINRKDNLNIVSENNIKKKI